MSHEAHDRPSAVFGEAGEVMLEGPGGAVMSLTPKAARETGERLRQAADDAENEPEKN